MIWWYDRWTNIITFMMNPHRPCHAVRAHRSRHHGSHQEGRCHMNNKRRVVPCNSHFRSFNGLQNKLFPRLEWGKMIEIGTFGVVQTDPQWRCVLSHMPQLLAFWSNEIHVASPKPRGEPNLLSIEAGIAIQVFGSPWQDDLQSIEEAIWQGAPHIDDLAHLTKREMIGEWGLRLLYIVMYICICIYVYTYLRRAFWLVLRIQPRCVGWRAPHRPSQGPWCSSHKERLARKQSAKSWYLESFKTV